MSHHIDFAALFRSFRLQQKEIKYVFSSCFGKGF